MWHTLAILPFLFGSANTAGQNDYCVATASDMRVAIADGEANLPPGVRTLLLDITDGKQHAVENDVLHMRSGFDAEATSKWLNVALFHATFYNRPKIADWLIRQGANVDAHTVNLAFAGSRHPNDGQMMWPPIEQAADCGNTATLNVLLAHHADMYSSLHEPRPEPGALLLAIMEKHEDAAEVLLDHGYNPCLIYSNYYPGPDRPTAAELARRMGLSSSLVRRLTKLSSSCALPTNVETNGIH